MTPRPKLEIPEYELGALARLNGNGVDYLVIGGYAMRFFGQERDPNDLDVLTHNSTDSAGRLYKAILAIGSDHGFVPSFSEAELREPSKQIKLGALGPDLDILTSVEGLRFETAYQNRTDIVESGISIPVVSSNDLIFIKRVAISRDPTRRNKEQADIDFLESL